MNGTTRRTANGVEYHYESLPTGSKLKKSGGNNLLTKMPNEYFRKKRREYRSANPEHFRRLERCSKLRTKYGISVEQWQAMFDKQEGRCAGCRKAFGNDRSNKPCVDHNHETMEFRGLLCHECNRGIGLLKESIVTMLRLVRYLMR